MSGTLKMSSAAVNAEHGALLEGSLPTYCLDFYDPAAVGAERHEAAVYVFLCEDSARRLAACWNACEGVSTERLESDTAQGYEPWGHVQHLQAQRDELLAAFEEVLRISDRKHDAWDRAHAAIAAAKGGAA